MDNLDPYYVLLAIATNITVLLMTGFVLQGHKYKCPILQNYRYVNITEVGKTIILSNINLGVCTNS